MVSKTRRLLFKVIFLCYYAPGRKLTGQPQSLERPSLEMPRNNNSYRYYTIEGPILVRMKSVCRTGNIYVKKSIKYFWVPN